MAQSFVPIGGEGSDIVVGGSDDYDSRRFNTSSSGQHDNVSIARTCGAVIAVLTLFAAVAAAVLGLVVLIDLSRKSNTDDNTAQFASALQTAAGPIIQGVANLLAGHVCEADRCPVVLTSCWQTLTKPNTLYIFGSSLVCINDSAPAFSVSADNVEIDGRGYTLVTGTHIGINVTGRTGVHIHDVVFEALVQRTTGGWDALTIESSSNVRVHDVRFSRHSCAIVVDLSSGVTIERAQGRGSIGFATAFTPSAIVIRGSEHVTLRDSSFHDNDTSHRSIAAVVRDHFGARSRDIRFENVDLVGYSTSILLMTTDDSLFTNVHTQRGTGNNIFANVQIGSSSVASSVTNIVFDGFVQSQSPNAVDDAFGVWIVRGINVEIRNSQFATDIHPATLVPVVAVGHPSDVLFSDLIVLRNIKITLPPLFNQSLVSNSALSFRSIAGGSILVDNCQLTRGTAALSILDANGLITVRNSVFSQAHDAGIAATSGPNGALRLVLDNNVIANNCGTGVWLDASVQSAMLKDNVISHNGAGVANGISDFGMGTILHSSNVVYGNNKMACQPPKAFANTVQQQQAVASSSSGSAEWQMILL